MKTLRQYMEENKVTCVELGKFLGIGESGVSNWVNGRCRPSINNWKALVELLGITESLDEMFPQYKGCRRWGAVVSATSEQNPHLLEECKILTDLRDSCSFTNVTLAKALGVKKEKLKGWLEGNSSIPQNYTKRLAELLQISVNDLQDFYLRVSRSRHTMRSLRDEGSKRDRKKPDEVQKKEISGLPVSLPQPPPPKKGVFVLIIKADNSYFAAGEWMTVKVFLL